MIPEYREYSGTPELEDEFNARSTVTLTEYGKPWTELSNPST
jgi:hypothetical protein